MGIDGVRCCWCCTPDVRVVIVVVEDDCGLSRAEAVIVVVVVLVSAGGAARARACACWAIEGGSATAMATRVSASLPPPPRAVGEGPQPGGMEAAQRVIPAESLPGHCVEGFVFGEGEGRWLGEEVLVREARIDCWCWWCWRWAEGRGM